MTTALMTTARWISIVALLGCFATPPGDARDTPAPAPTTPSAPPDRAAFGHVVNLKKEPVAGAEVVVSATGAPEAAASPDEADPFRARTDPEGRFVFATVPGTTLRLQVTAPGYAPARVRGLEVVPGPGAVDLGTVVLVPGAAVTGRILDRRGEPVAGAGIHVLKSLLTPNPVVEERLHLRRPETTTAADGTFVVTDLPRASQVDLLVRSEDYLGASLRGVTVPPPRALTLVLEDAARLRGRTLDDAGEPIAGAHVTLAWQEMLDDLEIPSGPPVTRRAVSDDDGFFTVTGSRLGKARLHAEAAGYVAAEPRDVDLADGEEITVVLERGAVVEGRVVTEDGEAVAGMRILAGDAAAFTDSEGAYRITGARPGPSTAETAHPHFETQRQELEIEPGTNVLDWTFPTGQEVRGQVVDTAGSAVGGAMVVLRPAADLSWREYRGHTDAGGYFELSGVVEGSYRLLAEHGGYAPAELPGAVRVAGEPVTDLELVLDPGASIAGRVLGLGFDELVEVRIQATNATTDRTWKARPDFEGRYRISGLPQGDYLVVASLRAGQRQTEARIPLAPGGADVTRDLVFGTGLTLTGRVGYDGEPLSGALVSIRSYEAAVERSVRTDYEGEFRFQDLEPGEYWLGLRHEREHLVHNDTIDIRADENVVLDLAAAVVRGRLVDAATREPVPGATVALTRTVADGARDPGGMLAGGSDVEGRFLLPRVPPGRYRLAVRKDGYEPAEETVEVAAGAGAEDLRLALTAAPGLELGVWLENGETPLYVDVRVSDATGRTVVAESRRATADGRVRLPNVPPGRWELLLSAPGGAPARLRADVPGEGVTVVLPAAGDLRVRVPALAASNQLAVLRLVGSDGTVFQGLDRGGRLHDGWQLLGGRTVVERLPKETWTLYVEASDGRRWSGTATTTGVAGEVVLE